MPTTTLTEYAHLHAAGVSVVLAWSESDLPVVLHWGEGLALDVDELDLLPALLERPRALNGPDVAVRVGLLPEASRGWTGTPGLQGHRDSQGWAPRFRVTRFERSRNAGGDQLTYTALDDLAGLGLRLEVELTSHGVLRCRAAVTNIDGDDYIVDGLDLLLPLSDDAAEVLDFAGRWGDERIPQRTPIRFGSHVRENRRGRTGHDASHLTIAGEPAFGFRSGQVWGVHVAWSGDHRTQVTRTPTGQQIIGGGELLLPGEMRLSPGEAYSSPWLWGVWGRGLDDQAARLHHQVRADAAAARSTPQPPRPVTLNVWEAVYFDHDLDRLLRLAEQAAAIGVERFVLDDGWFLGRRDDTAGLGDWTVDPDVWPHGLEPLVERVRALGMQFGLWFEPEMISDDSDLARAHPDWQLQVPGRRPLPSRHQQVLNLTEPGAYAHVLGQIRALVDRYDIAYIKWDHNRDLVDAATAAGSPATHDQTAAFYRLLAEVRRARPGIEIESCSSGGGRVDLGVIPLIDRFWASDNNDPLDRHRINLWTAQLVPAEYIGSHVSARRNHVTGRSSSIGIRALSALPWHFGLECDLDDLTDIERLELREWIELHKELRPLTRSGRLVRSDTTEPGQLLYGFVADDHSQAVYFQIALETPHASLGRSVTFPGLDDDLRYRFKTTARLGGAAGDLPGWFDEAEHGRLEVSGALLRQVGLRAPFLHPESFLVHHLRAQTPPSTAHASPASRIGSK